MNELSRRDFVKGVTTGIVTAGSLAGVGPVHSAEAQDSRNFPAFTPMAAKKFKSVDANRDIGKISAKTMAAHYTLYSGYIARANLIRGKLQTVSLAPGDANQTFSDIRELKVELTFAIGGIKNHEIYFSNLGTGESTRPGRGLMTQIEKDFGSMEKWAADLKATGIAGRGWAWTAWDDDEKRLFNYIGDAQNSFPIWNATPIVALDVYEHAYWGDFGTGRAAYIDEFLKVLDWEDATARFRAAARGRQ
jgi:Fe-Mn family superoxide dismutase